MTGELITEVFRGKEGGTLALPKYLRERLGISDNHEML